MRYVFLFILIVSASLTGSLLAPFVMPTVSGYVTDDAQESGASEVEVENDMFDDFGFDDAYRFVRGEEGGFVDHPADRGGATKNGVTQGTYNVYRRSWGKSTRSVKHLTEKETRRIYHSFWENAHCSEVAEKCPRLALAHFGWAIHTGPTDAIRTLQSSIGTLIDGKWGPMTRSALEECESDTALGAYLNRREALLRTQGHSGDQRAFREGWMNRIATVREYVQR